MPIPLVAIGAAGLSGFLKVGAGLFTKKAYDKQAAQVEEFSKKVGASYDDRIAFVEVQNEEEILDYRRALYFAESRGKATIAASGLRVSGAALESLTDHAINGQRDLDRLKAAHEYDLKNLHSEKDLKMEEYKVQAANLRASGKAALVSGVVGAISSVASGAAGVPGGGGNTPSFNAVSDVQAVSADRFRSASVSGGFGGLRRRF